MAGKDLTVPPRRPRREGVWFQGAEAKPDPKPCPHDIEALAKAIEQIAGGLTELAKALRPKS